MAAAPTERLTQRETAERLGTTRYMVRKLEGEGLPREDDGYPWPLVGQWYEEHASAE